MLTVISESKVADFEFNIVQKNCDVCLFNSQCGQADYFPFPLFSFTFSSITSVRVIQPHRKAYHSNRHEKEKLLNTK